MKLTLNKYKEFWNLLSTNVDANLKFAQKVVDGDSIHQYYFFGEYSKPILSWIIVHALYKAYHPEVEREIVGKYYEFVAGPFKDTVPQWYQLLCYKGKNDEKLHSWLKRNGCQWFRKDKIKEENVTSISQGKTVGDFKETKEIVYSKIESVIGLDYSMDNDYLDVTFLLGINDEYLLGKYERKPCIFWIFSKFSAFFPLRIKSSSSLYVKPIISSSVLPVSPSAGFLFTSSSGRLFTSIE